MDFYEQFWEQVKDLLKENVTGPAFNLWLKPLFINTIDDETKIVYLELPEGRGSDLILNNIKDRYLKLIEEHCSTVLGESYRVVVKLTSQYNNKPTENAIEEVKVEEVPAQLSSPTQSVTKTKTRKLNKQKLFNPKFTFDNFVVGNSNSFAKAACEAVADSPGEAYNPLFIYGGSGLGKTHLMHAIGIHLLSQNPDLNVLYVSSEMFTNEIIESLRVGRMSEFKRKYRSVDVLLIDDIQFLEGKETTQEEFFNTFNELYTLNKQIIISSDRPLEKLQKMDKRLTSRMGYNLVVDIQPPDFETRVAILKKMALDKKIDYNDDVYEVISNIAEKIEDNVRELEGAFNRVIAFAKFKNEVINNEMAELILSDLFSNSITSITPEKIKKAVAKKYGIKVIDLEGKRKTNDIAYPRQIAMYLIRFLTSHSFNEIGQMFGKRHHTTVKFACDKIEAEIKYDDKLKKEINEIKSEINS